MQAEVEIKIAFIAAVLGLGALAGLALATGDAHTVPDGGSTAAGHHPVIAPAGAITWSFPSTSYSCSSANVPVPTPERHPARGRGGRTPPER